ncbi:MAG TPA: anthranilate synthase component I [Chloroflexota bacterium]|nr:anthranilate synthase component I [Chloroflexota bacterium]
MYTPTLAQARALAGSARFVPMYREILADLETPVSAYLKYAAGRDSFLLESVEGIEHVGRYSFIGARPREVLDIREGGTATLETLACPDGGGGNRKFDYDDPLVLIDSLLGRDTMAKLPGLPRFIGGAVGFLTYEIARCFEKLPVPANDPHGLPLGRLMFVDSLLVFDHSRRTIKALTRLPLDGDLDANYREASERIEQMIDRLDAPTPIQRLESIPTHNEGIGLHDRVKSNVTPSEFMAMVRKAKEYITAGDIIQVVPSQRLSLETTADPFSIYRALRVVNPSPYMFFLDYGDYHIVGASPEMLTMVENGVIHNRPLAGTRWRGATPEEDDRLARELLADEKERAEHVMLVDLGRNDVGRVSTPGSVNVDELMVIEKYSHVMHIVSKVTGQLDPNLRPVDALRAAFPAGTVSGAPKIRAMEIIAELEKDRRGTYAGSVGLFNWDGELETAIALRTALVKDGVVHVQAGGGIVADSDPAFEYEETLNKAAALLRGVLAAERAARPTRQAQASAASAGIVQEVPAT